MGSGPGHAPGGSRNGGLDAIRLAAATLVFIPHALTAAGLLSFRDGLVELGGLGVSMFFVLSGYLIPTVFASRSDGYVVRRLARILPGYWLAVVGLAVITGGPVLALAMAQPIDITARPSATNFIPVVWTLRVELVFYALVPLIARLPMWAVMAVGSISLAAWLVAPGIGVEVHLWRFVPGVLLARLPPSRALPWSIGALGLALLAVELAVPGDIAGIAGAAVLVAVAVSRPIAIPSWVAYGAAISYGVYLWHQPLLWRLHDLGLAPLPLIAAGIGLTIGAAAASWHLVETPLNRVASGQAGMVTARLARVTQSVRDFPRRGDRR